MTLKVHEQINEIPTVPIYYLVKPLPRERAHCPYLLSGETTAKGTGLAKSVGKEDPVDLGSSLLV